MLCLHLIINLDSELLLTIGPPHIASGHLSCEMPKRGKDMYVASNQDLIRSAQNLRIGIREVD